jgi:hypothetical protein
LSEECKDSCWVQIFSKCFFAILQVSLAFFCYRFYPNARQL